MDSLLRPSTLVLQSVQAWNMHRGTHAHIRNCACNSTLHASSLAHMNLNPNFARFALQL
jgi:hypothetical protein